MHKTLCALALGVVTLSATAVDANGKFGAHGARSCGEFLEAQKNPDKLYERAVIEGWMMGWVTGYNTMARDTYDIMGTTNLSSIRQWMTDYCAKNPQDPLSTGMIELALALQGSRKKTGQ
jgi:hypothetical protein